MSPGIPITSRL